MKKRTLSKLKSIFGGKSKGKRHQQQSTKSSRTPSPDPGRGGSPAPGSCQPVQRTPPPSRAGPPPSPPVPTNPVAPVAPEPQGPISLTPCLVCGRTFVPQSLSKHVKICEKMAAKRRKTFDSSRQRREGLPASTGVVTAGTDLEQFLPKNFGLPENSPFLEKSPPQTAKTLPKTKPASVRHAIMKPSTELQRCPHCSRAFGPRAFERHVEWCADKAKILPAAPAHPPPHIADAKQRLNARTQYKAPLARGRRSSQSRDKSSNSRSASVESSRGVSPPPREYGDYRVGRSRASESVSSNDHDEPSPHVPVIRNSRSSLNNCGDANVKARQARLARDLSSTRETTKSPSIPSEQSNNDENVKQELIENEIGEEETEEKETVEVVVKKQKYKLSETKQKQLKKLELLAQKYKQRNEKFKEERKEETEKRKAEFKKKINDKSHIPVSKNTANTKNKINQSREQNAKNVEVEPHSPRHTKKGARLKNNENKPTETKVKTDVNDKNKQRKETKKYNVKESTMSLDSLDDHQIAKPDKNCQSIGINTELVCPCVPCVIYGTSDPKPKERKHSTKIQSKKHQIEDAKVELLYKNPTIIEPSEQEDKVVYEIKEGHISLSKVNYSMATLSSSDHLASDDNDSLNNKKIINKKDIDINDAIKHKTVDTYINTCKTNSEVQETSPTDSLEIETDIINDDSLENLIDEKCESEDLHDSLADANAEKYAMDNGCDFDNKNELYKDADSKNSRHGSGETYTKFSENPADLEEFLNVTDQMIGTHNYNEIEFDVDKDMSLDLHTPNTDSIEAIANHTPDKSDNNALKPEFSDTLAELKNNLKLLLDSGGEKLKNEKPSEVSKEIQPAHNICDMEHITIYGLKEINATKQTLTKKKVKKIEKSFQNKHLSEKEVLEFKLPSITDSNKQDKNACLTNEEMRTIYKPNKKYKLLKDQNKTGKEFKTFIKEHEDNSDTQSISAEAPPLKLPRIENKRIDDNYDPFLSAARQMKELMSSETNIPKKLQTSTKSLNGTLPNIRLKDKTPNSYLRQDNTKTMKDSMNRTYQKTPTLQRMKSFGSTNNDNGPPPTTFGSRCSSFRVKNEKKSSQKLNTTFTKSSKENISNLDKNIFNRNSSMNRSFSSYSTSTYSTPKPRDKIPKIASSMHHSFQRTTIKQPTKIDKNEEKKNFVNLDSILADDNSSMTDSNYIDPRLINENDNLPINVNTILNNPDIISSMESLLTTENLPAKFESFSANLKNNNIKNKDTKVYDNKLIITETNTTTNGTAPKSDDMSVQYDKIMSSLEQSLVSKTSIRDDDSLCEELDLEEFMTSFDDDLNKKSEKRICSSTTRIVKQSELVDSNKNSQTNSICSTPKLTHSSSNGSIPFNKSISVNYSSNNNANDSLFPSCVKRSTSLLDSIQKRNVPKAEGGKSRHKVDQLEQDLMQSLKDFDKFYEKESQAKEANGYHMPAMNGHGTAKRESRVKSEKKSNKHEDAPNGNYTPNGKTSNDSAYSSLNRISPSKLSICNSKEANGLDTLDKIPAGSDSSGVPRDEMRSASSEEFLAMERSAELNAPITTPQERSAQYGKDAENNKVNNDKRPQSRASSRQSPWRGAELSSSGSESSVHAPRHGSGASSAPRLSRFCHECGSKFPFDSAKFCIECGVKRLLV